uniref:Uncharacterized protein n=1 Tax=Astyanax mexicanus TaxID=7994 RepID=A0A3B1J5S7_ASTMX
PVPASGGPASRGQPQNYALDENQLFFLFFFEMESCSIAQAGVQCLLSSWDYRLETGFHHTWPGFGLKLLTPYAIHPPQLPKSTGSTRREPTSTRRSNSFIVKGRGSSESPGPKGGMCWFEKSMFKFNDFVLFSKHSTQKRTGQQARG